MRSRSLSPAGEPLQRGTSLEPVQPLTPLEDLRKRKDRSQGNKKVNLLQNVLDADAVEAFKKFKTIEPRSPTKLPQPIISQKTLSRSPCGELLKDKESAPGSPGRRVTFGKIMNQANSILCLGESKKEHGDGKERVNGLMALLLGGGKAKETNEDKADDIKYNMDQYKKNIKKIDKEMNDMN